MRRSGHYEPATDLLTDVALDLHSDRNDTPDDVLAVYGSLMLTAGYSAAQNGRQADAQQLLDEAAGTAQRIHRRADSGLFANTFGTDQVNLYGLSIHHALGNDTTALQYAQAVRIAAPPTAERRARFCLDLARTHHALNNSNGALQALLVAERFAPEDVQRASVRALTADLLYSPGHVPGLRAFAQRTGVEL